MNVEFLRKPLRLVGNIVSEVALSRQSFQSIVKLELTLFTYKKQKFHGLKMAREDNRLNHSNKLYMGTHMKILKILSISMRSYTAAKGS